MGLPLPPSSTSTSASTPTPTSTSQGKPKSSSVVSFLGGATSGCISTLTLQPFDVVKTRMQMSAAFNRSVHLQPSLILQPNANALDTFRGIVRQDRISGLWRGVTPSVLRNTIGVGLHFMTLNAITAKLSSADGTLSDLATLSSGAVARSISVILLCPLSVVKTRMETVEYASKYKDMFHAVRVIASQEGTRGLFSGLFPAIVRDAPYSAMYLYIYLRTKEVLGRAVGLKDNRSTILLNSSNHSSASSSTCPSSSLPRSSSTNAAATSTDSSTTSASSTNDERTILHLNQQGLKRLVNFASGALGGGLATLLTQPQDVIKTRMQLSQRSADGTPSRYNTVSEATRRVFNEEGFYGFFRGASPRFIKRILGSAIVWMVFEEVNAFFSKIVDQRSSNPSKPSNNNNTSSR